MKKFVLTGGHGVGKTSLLLALEMQGEYILREAASDYQRFQRANGIPFPSDHDDFEQNILEIHLRRESQIPSSISRVFIDRGKPDHVVYSDIFHWPLPALLKQAALTTDYTKIFFVECFGAEWAEKVSAREQEESRRIARELISIYEQLGYDVVRVPPGKLNERVQFILSYT